MEPCIRCIRLCDIIVCVSNIYIYILAHIHYIGANSDLTWGSPLPLQDVAIAGLLVAWSSVTHSQGCNHSNRLLIGPWISIRFLRPSKFRFLGKEIGRAYGHYVKSSKKSVDSIQLQFLGHAQCSICWLGFRNLPCPVALNVARISSRKQTCPR